MEFNVLLDSSFSDVCTKSISPQYNKYVLSIANDFEEGSWRHKNFHMFIWDNIAETSLSSQEREALVNKSSSLLTASAANLRLTDKETDIGKGSELAEIFLYGIMKHHYGALPVVPKIFYKQNVQDNAKGADSVHLVVHGDDFSLWFGEAKFYKSIENARLGSIVTSVKNSLKPDKLKKENSIVTNVSDIDHLIENSELRQRIKDVLSSKVSLDTIKPKIHVPIFILHECEVTQGTSMWSEEYQSQVADYHLDRANAYFEKQISEMSDIHLYDQITFHIILFPVPNKAQIVDKFVQKVEFLKEEF
ncbi:HamA C-terminal domain-containing protein [Vibrio astriarenae]|uniref:HamA C-terminal domain-containing protein n=1 Tax=Vibrio astriarenae TaxID=1481923 RepID=UPI003735C9A6